MMRLNICFLLGLNFLCSDLTAQSFEDVSEIIFNKCSVCHRPGEIGPMPFTNYEEVKSWSGMIKRVTQEKYMPPWQPDPNYSRFQGESFLSEDEIQLISDWVDNGAIQGNPSREAEFPEFPDGSALGEPDLVLSMTQAHVHKGNNQDEYRWFVLPTGLTEDKVVKAVEFRAGNRQIVHHALIFEDANGVARAQDARTPEYGYEGFGSFAGDDSDDIGLLTAKQFQGYAPGAQATIYPDGIGQVLKAGADLAVQLHYAPSSKDEEDLSSVNIFFADDDEVVDRSLQSHIMVPLPGVLVNRQFFILAEEEFEFHGIWEVPNDISIVGIAPHMHLLGKDWTVFLEFPDGTTENLISIPEWDFNWQGSYFFNEYKVAPQGTKLHAFATYDNTSDNPNNPNNPPQFMTWGEGTEDEMYYLPILFADYKEGDEFVSFASSTTSVTELSPESKGQLFPISPNPVEDDLFLEYQLEKGLPISIQLLDQQGRLLRNVRSNVFHQKGNHALNIQTNNLESGVYFIRLIGNNVLHTASFVKIN